LNADKTWTFPRLRESDIDPGPYLGKCAPIVRLLYRTALMSDGCWIWRGAKDGHGYGEVGFLGGTISTHRLAYTVLVGPIPQRLELDHLCRNTACCNPAHLEPVTHLENMRRGIGNQNHGKTSCPRGHAYDEANTYVYKNGRFCRSCNRAAQARCKAAGRTT